MERLGLGMGMGVDIETLWLSLVLGLPLLRDGSNRIDGLLSIVWFVLRGVEVRRSSGVFARVWGAAFTCVGGGRGCEVRMVNLDGGTEQGWF